MVLRKVAALGAVLAFAGAPLAAQTTCPAGSRWEPIRPRSGIIADYGPPQVGELALKGIVKTAKGYMAMIEDCRFGKSHSVRVGQRFEDGRVSEIDAEGVTFEMEVEATAPPKTKRLTLKKKQ